MTTYHDYDGMDVTLSEDGRQTTIDAAGSAVAPFRVRIRFLEDLETDTGLAALYEWSVCRLEPVGEEFAGPDGQVPTLESDVHRGIGVGFDSALRSARLVAAVRGWSGWTHNEILKLVRGAR